jgi:hypothetical protein
VTSDREIVHDVVMGEWAAGNLNRECAERIWERHSFGCAAVFLVKDTEGIKDNAEALSAQRFAEEAKSNPRAQTGVSVPQVWEMSKKDGNTEDTESTEEGEEEPQDPGARPAPRAPGQSKEKAKRNPRPRHTLRAWGTLREGWGTLKYLGWAA